MVIKKFIHNGETRITPNFSNVITHLETLLKNAANQLNDEGFDHIELIIDDLTEQEYKSLFTSLYNSHLPLQLTLTSTNKNPQVEKYNQSLEEIFTKNVASFKLNQFRESAKIKKLADHKKTIADLRRAKVNMVNGVASNMPLQQQQQQQLQRKNRSANDNKATGLSAKNKHYQHNFKIDTNDNNDFITRENIIERLQGFLRTIDPAANEDLLLTIWDNLVGKNANKIVSSERKITQIDICAMQQIIKHYKEFQDGINLERLPLGFEIKTKINQNNYPCETRLYYDAELEKREQESQYSDPFQLNLFYDKQAIIPAYLSYLHTLNPHKLTSDSLALAYQTNDIALQSYHKLCQQLVTDSKQDSVDASEYLLSLLKEKDPHYSDKLATIGFANNTPFNVGLAKIVFKFGTEAATLFLEQLIQCKTIQPERFLKLTELFINGHADLTQFASEEGRDHLKWLSDLKSTEFDWFIALANQHIAVGAQPDFNRLVKSFDVFLTRIKKVKDTMGEELELPQKCPFNNIKNMIIALDRMLFIIGYNNAIAEQNEQINQLLASGDDKSSAIDLSNEGAYYAKKYEQYNVITQGMNLSSEHFVADEDEFSYQSLSLSKLAEKALDKKTSFADIKQGYFRYLGQKDCLSYELVDYLNLAQQIENLDQGEQTDFTQELKKHADWKNVLLVLVLINMTEARPGEDLETSSLQLEKFIAFLRHSLSETTSKAAEQAADQAILVDQYVFPALLAMAKLDIEARPTLAFMINLSDMLAEEGQDKLKDFYICLPNLMQFYGIRFKHITDLCAKRNAKAMSCTSDDIVKLKISQLINELNNNIVFTQDQQNADHRVRYAYAELLPLVADVSDDAALAKMKEQLLAINNPEFVTIFARVMQELNFERTKKLPTSAGIIAVMRTCYQKCSLLGEDKFEDTIKNELINSAVLKDVVFGYKTLDQTKFGIVDVMKKYLADHDIMAPFPKKSLQEKLGIQNSIIKLEESIHKFENLLNSNTNATNLKIYLDLLSNINTQVKDIITPLKDMKFVGGLVSHEIKGSLDGYLPIGVNKEKAEQLKNEFMNNPTIMVFIREEINNNCLAEIKKIFSKLSMSGSELEHACETYLGRIDNISGALDAIVESYANKFESIIKFTNLLAEIRNGSEAEFIKLKEVIKLYITDQNQHLSIDQLSNLFIAVARLQIKLSPAEQRTELEPSSLIHNLNLIYQNLPDDASEYINAVLSSINVVIQLQKILPPEYLLKLSSAILTSVTNNSAKGKTANTNSVEKVYLLQKEQITALTELLNDTSMDISKVSNLIVTMMEMANRLANRDISAANEFVNTTISSLIKDSKQIPELLDFISIFFKVSLHEEGFAGAQFSNIVHALLEKADQAKTIIEIIKNISVSTDGKIDDSLNVNRLAALVQQLTKFPRGKAELKDVANLYSVKPYPRINDLTYIETLLTKLNLDEQALKTDLTNIDLDPFKLRTPDYTAAQFNTERVVPIVGSITNMVNAQKLGAADMRKLEQQCLFINSIGKDYVLPECKKKLNHEKKLVDCTRTDLQTLAHELIKDLSKTKQSDQQRELLELQLLAVLREVMYRTTGEFPYTTQLISILHSINHPENLLLQINTGEGKSITTALFAVMQYAKGHSVDVCTANMDLASRDFDHFKDFFAFLEIPAGKINANNVEDKDQYHVGGINYSTVADLSLYRSRAKLENIDLNHLNDEKLKTSLILDEVDYNTLDNRTLFNYTMNAKAVDSYLNKCKWIYEIINDFIESKEFTNLNIANGAYSSLEDVIALEKYIKNYKSINTDPSKIKLLATIKDEDPTQLNRWLDAACQANSLKLDRDYAITCNAETGKAWVVPKNKNVPQPGSTYRNGVQQFLHARLAKQPPAELSKNKKYEFDIDTELRVSVSESVKNFIDYYGREGRIIGLSGTLGTASELFEQHYNLKAGIYSIPPHKKNIRQVQYIPQKNSKDVIKAIKQELATHKHLLDPHVNLEIKRGQQFKNDICIRASHYDRKAWDVIKALFTKIANAAQTNHVLNHQQYLKFLSPEKLSYLRYANESIFQAELDVKAIINKLIEHAELTAEDCDLMQSITQNAHYHLAWKEEKQLPQPTLLICKDSIKAQQLFSDMTGLSTTDWDSVRECLKKLSPYYKENDNLKSIPAEQYAKEMPDIKLLSLAKNTIFKDAPDIQKIIDKVIQHQDLSFCEIRTLIAIGNNNYHHQKQNDFVEFKNIVIAIANKSELPKDFEAKIAFMVQDPFKHEPEIARILKNINTDSWPNAKELATLKNVIARPWYDYNQDTYFEYELVVGNESETKREEKIAKAGNPYSVTISTTLLGRGTDVKTQHPERMRVIQTYLDTVRNTQQIMGRCARNGEPGKYLFIYNANEINEKPQLKFNHAPVHQKNIPAINHIQQIMDEDAAVERYYVQEVDSLSNLVMREFQRLEKFINELYDTHDNVYDIRMQALRKVRIDLIQKLDKAWDDILDEPIPEDQTSSNAYIRRNAHGDLQYKELDEGLARFESNIKSLWISTRNSVIQDYLVDRIDKAPNIEFAQQKLRYLQKISLNELFAKRKTIQRKEVQNTQGDGEWSKNKIKASYVGNEVFQLTSYLQSNLKWVENTDSLQYKIERKEICDVARALLAASEKLQTLPSVENLDRFRRLLETQQLKTKKLWSLNWLNPFGHMDCRKLMKHGLSMLERINYQQKDAMLKKHSENKPETECEILDPNSYTDKKFIAYKQHQLKNIFLSQDSELKLANPHFELSVTPHGGRNDYVLLLEVDGAYQPPLSLDFSPVCNNSAKDEERKTYRLSKINLYNKLIATFGDLETKKNELTKELAALKDELTKQQAKTESRPIAVTENNANLMQVPQDVSQAADKQSENNGIGTKLVNMVKGLYSKYWYGNGKAATNEVVTNEVVTNEVATNDVVTNDVVSDTKQSQQAKEQTQNVNTLEPAAVLQLSLQSSIDEKIKAIAKIDNEISQNLIQTKALHISQTSRITQALQNKRAHLDHKLEDLQRAINIKEKPASEGRAVYKRVFQSLAQLSEFTSTCTPQQFTSSLSTQAKEGERHGIRYRFSQFKQSLFNLFKHKHQATQSENEAGVTNNMQLKVNA